MGSFSENHIDSYERKVPVYQIHRLCQEGRIVFPSVPLAGKQKRTERISETVEAILLGITLPVIYVSERQNGSLLVLESGDRLRYLIEFLEGRYPVMGLEFYPEMDGCAIAHLEARFPRAVSLLYDYKICLQIIEYTTPRYMHMQVGNYIEKWSFAREQGIRNGLYGEEAERFLSLLVWNLRGTADFLSRWKLNRQYMMLRILMCRFVFEGVLRGMREKHTGLQFLLEQTTEYIGRQNTSSKMQLVSDIRAATEELMRWAGERGFNLSGEKGKEWQARTLGYLYNVIWMCREKGCPVQRGLDQIAADEQLWNEISTDKVSFANIRRHGCEIERRLGQSAELYKNTGL